MKIFKTITGKIFGAKIRKVICPSCDEKIKPPKGMKLDAKADYVFLQCQCGVASVWDFESPEPKFVVSDIE